MEPYKEIVPDSPDPVLTLALPKKSGKIPKGSYSFTEWYCTDPGCDCRRVVIRVDNEKNKTKAVINFGFDQKDAFGGPYLDGSSAQAPYASELVSFFVDSLNGDHQLLDRLYRHYRQVREQVEKKPYRGKPFPKPGDLVYRVTPPPDLEAEMLQSLQNLRGSGAKPAAPGRSAAAKSRPVVPPPPEEERDMAWLVRRYTEAGPGAPMETVVTLRNDLLGYLLDKEGAAQELARLLPELCRQSPQDEDAVNAALRLLFDALQLLDAEMRKSSAGAGQRMEKLQQALARHVFGGEDLDLSAAVWNMLAQSRVEIIPALREAVTGMMMDGGQRTDLDDMASEEIMSGILRSLESLGVSSPFQAADEMLQLFTLTEPELQIALLGEMLQAENALLRDMSALMILNPEPEVRLGVSRLLAESDGSGITSETLRRLIMSRNWFPEEIRKKVDQTVGKARKARVECAPLQRPAAVTVLASTIDGSGAQAFHVMVPEGSNFAHCGFLVKEGAGVTDVLLGSLKSKGEVNALLARLKKDATIAESSAEYLDLRVCHALAHGVAAGKVPSHWLVRVAELLGRDRWQPIRFDAARELLQLWEELQWRNAKLLDAEEYRASLEESARWQTPGSFLASWFESGDEVGREIAALKGKDKGAADAAAERIIDGLLEKRRAVWLERLVIGALWLKSGDKGPVPWHKMFHVAQAVADETIPLRDIPLMVSIARLTVAAHVALSQSASTKLGE
jgi:hypothetical protein